MTVFNRDGHLRTNGNGTTFWVRGHKVRRDHWDLQGSLFGSAQYRASDFLRRSNVGHGVQGCFVNPNAKCPECGVPVFFYANAFGSRVYFDELGPPWPKHPCTDNPRPTRPIIHPDWTPITTRKKGQIREIIDCANQSGLFRRKEFGVRNADEWTLLVVEEVKRSGELEEIRAAFIDTLETRSIRLSCFTAEPTFEPGDLLSMKGGEFAFFDRRTMQSCRFRDGKRLTADEMQGSSAPHSTAAGPSPLPQQQTRPNLVLPAFNPLIFHRKDMSRKEDQHIPAKIKNNRQYRKLWAEKIMRMATEGARTPEHFAVRLNALGSRTAKGEEWTPKLARYFVSYVIDFHKSSNIAVNAPGSAKPEPPKQSEIIDATSVSNQFCFGLSYEELHARSIKPINWLRRQGITNPNDIADRLNRANLSPSKQIKWTGLSVQLLLELHDLGIRTNEQASALVLAEQQPKKVQAQLSPTSSHSLATSAPLPKSEIARRLAIIGRVSMKED